MQDETRVEVAQGDRDHLIRNLRNIGYNAPRHGGMSTEAGNLMLEAADALDASDTRPRTIDPRLDDLIRTNTVAKGYVNAVAIAEGAFAMGREERPADREAIARVIERRKREPDSDYNRGFNAGLDAAHTQLLALLPTPPEGDAG